MHVCQMAKSVELTDAMVKRFWSLVEIGQPDECWKWSRCKRKGYGKFRGIGSHRFAYAATYGWPDPVLVVAHKCDNPTCCNPSHLEAISRGQNVVDAWDRIGFDFAKGQDRFNAKLDDSMVRQIRWLHRQMGWGHRRIKSFFGLDTDTKTISNIYKGVTWRHVEGIEQPDAAALATFGDFARCNFAEVPA